jgi:two-component system sensor histidine kinase ArlS
MKITTKINLLITAWLVLILLVVNTIVFFSFMKMTVNMEEDLMLKKVHEILKKNPVSYSLTVDEGRLRSYLSSHSYIRLVNQDSKVITQVINESDLNRIKPKFSKVEKSELKAFNESQNLVVRVPIIKDHKVIGTMEMGERLTGLESRKDILLSVLGTITGISMILSLLAGRWLSNVIMKPIVNLIKAMENIEQSGVPKTIIVENETKDELQKMTNTFNRMIEKLQENTEKQRQFISDASHEIKTPLTIISSYSNLLRRHGLENKEIVKEAIESIYSETNRIQSLTQSLLSLAESEHIKNIEWQSVDIVALCQTISRQLQVVHNRSIQIHTSSPSLFINGDELKLKQVMIIFVDNAIKYSKDDIHIFIEKDDRNAILRVKDRGIGIQAEEIENIFERFYRVDKVRSRETGGTGLGLSIAKNILNLHNGSIKIHSEVNIGTEIEIELPLYHSASKFES